jgi:hypothetical protein
MRFCETKPTFGQNEVPDELMNDFDARSCSGKRILGGSQKAVGKCITNPGCSAQCEMYRTNPIARMTAHDFAPDEPTAEMMAVELQRTNPIAGMTADENSPNEATGRNVISRKRNPI